MPSSAGLPHLPLAALQRRAVLAAAARKRAHRPAARLDARARPAGLRLFRPQRSTSPRASAASSATGASTRCRASWRVAPLEMQWCLDCHRDPAPHLRPREQRVRHGFRPPPTRASRPRSCRARTCAERASPIARHATDKDHAPRLPQARRASAALASAGCAPPAEKIVPYAHQPEARVARRAALLCERGELRRRAPKACSSSRTPAGRPRWKAIPRTRRASARTSVHGQASVLQLWDPERSKAPRSMASRRRAEQLKRELAGCSPARRARRRGCAMLIGASDLADARARSSRPALSAIRERACTAGIRCTRRSARRRAPRVRPRLEPIARLEEAGAILSLDAASSTTIRGASNYARAARARPHAAGRDDEPAVRVREHAFARRRDGGHRYARPRDEIEDWLASPRRRFGILPT